MSSYFELVKPINYKYGLIFKISELQTPELLLITSIRESENCTAEYIGCTPRGKTYVYKGADINKGVYNNMLLLILSIVTVLCLNHIPSLYFSWLTAHHLSSTLVQELLLDNGQKIVAGGYSSLFCCYVKSDYALRRYIGASKLVYEVYA